MCLQLLTSKGPDSEVKLIDFGLAKEMSDPVARSFLGTRGYLAPEMLQRHSYDKAIDIWVRYFCQPVSPSSILPPYNE